MLFLPATHCPSSFHAFFSFNPLYSVRQVKPYYSHFRNEKTETYQGHTVTQDLNLGLPPFKPLLLSDFLDSLLYFLKTQQSITLAPGVT